MEEFRSQQHKRVFHIEWTMIVIEHQQLWNKSFSYHLKFKCLEDQQKILIHSGVHVLLLKSKRIVRKQLTGNKFKKHKIPIFKGPSTLNTRFFFSNTNSSFWLHTLPVSMLWIPSGKNTFGALDANNQYILFKGQLLQLKQISDQGKNWENRWKIHLFGKLN